MTARHGYAAAQVVITGVLFYFLARNVEWDVLGGLFGRLPIWFYLFSLAVITSGQALYAWRWSELLRATQVQIPYARVFEQYLIGLFFNNFLPSTVGGDALKVYTFGRHHGYRTVTTSIVLDRLLSVGLLSVLALVSLWMSALTARPFAAARGVLSLVVLAIAAGIALSLSGSGGLTRRLSMFGRRAAAGGEHLRAMRLDIAAAIRQPAVVARSGVVVLIYFLAITSVYGVFMRLTIGHQPPFLSLLAVITVTSVLTNVPVAFNGLGLREQLHVILLAPLGVPKEAAIAISLIVFAHLILVSMIGGVLWMRQAPPSIAPSLA